MNLKIGFIGLSHLGFTYSLATASKKFTVIAFDFNKNLINDLNNNVLHVEEPGAANILKK